MAFVNPAAVNPSGYIIQLPLLIYALASAYTDLKSRRINLWLSLAAAMAGIWSLYIKSPGVKEVLEALLPGICLIILSLISRGNVGMGDAIFITVCGLYLDPADILLLVIIAWLISAAAALFLVAAGGTGKNISRAGIPFAAVCLPVLILITAGNMMEHTI